MEELEDYRVDLNEGSVLELTIQPELTAGNAIARLGEWRVARLFKNMAERLALSQVSD
jgi:hypothetical protein